MPPDMQDFLISPRIKASFIVSLLGLVAVLSIGTAGYRIVGGPQYSLLDCFYMTFTTTAAFILEGDMNLALRRRRMHNLIERLRNHYIICGVGRVGGNVAHELVV